MGDCTMLQNNRSNTFHLVLTLFLIRNRFICFNAQMSHTESVLRIRVWAQFYDQDYPCEDQVDRQLVTDALVTHMHDNYGKVATWQ